MTTIAGKDFISDFDRRLMKTVNTALQKKYKKKQKKTNKQQKKNT